MSTPLYNIMTYIVGTCSICLGTVGRLIVDVTKGSLSCYPPTNNLLMRMVVSWDTLASPFQHLNPISKLQQVHTPVFTFGLLLVLRSHSVSH